MNLNLKDKVALVTGGSKGIGQAMSLALAREGVKVAICGRSKAALAETLVAIERENGCGLAIAADITKAADIKKVFKKIMNRWGKLDILINNAGGATQYGDFNSLTAKDWRSCYELNVISTVEVCRAFLPALRQSSNARIINMASLVGLKPGFYNPHYAAAKAAVINYSQHLAKALAKDKILVNVICAGPVHSDAWQKNIAHVARLKQKSFKAAQLEFEAQETAKIPLGRVGEGQDVAGLVVFLASAQASWITGGCFRVDGGKGTL